MKAQSGIVVTLSFVLFTFSISSCNKPDKISVSSTQIPVPTDLNIRGIHFFNTQVGVVCSGKRKTAGKIFRTTDAGQTWSETYSILDNTFYDLFFLDTLIGYACGENLLLMKTTDGGQSWNRGYLPQELVDSNRWRDLKSILFVNDSTGYIAGGQNLDAGILAVTTDGAATWSYELPETEFNNIYFNGADGVAGGFGTFYISSDNGLSFEPINFKSDHYTGLSFTSVTEGWACGYNGGIYKTSNLGRNWSKQIKPNQTFGGKRIHFNDIVMDATNGLVVGEHGVVWYYDGTWHRVKPFSKESFYCVQQLGNEYYVGGEGNLFVTSR